MVDELNPPPAGPRHWISKFSGGQSLVSSLRADYCRLARHSGAIEDVVSFRGGV